MTFARRLKLFLFGFLIGIFFLILIFGNKEITWAYFPNDRVLAEIQTKEKKFSTVSNNFLLKNNLSKKIILDSALVYGKINFKESNAQLEPCPIYQLNYKKLKIYLKKCKNEVIIDSILDEIQKTIIN